MSKKKITPLDTKEDVPVMSSLDYGIIYKFNNGYSLWYEPITDILDGFVIRDSKDNIYTVFSEDKIDNKYKYSEYHDRKYSSF